MQSSPAFVAVVLTAVFGGIIDFSQAAGMVIGANVGSVVPILLVSISGIPAKKQTALGSLTLIVMPSLPLLSRAVSSIVDPVTNPTLAIAAFHTLFNLVAVLLFYPAIPRLAGRLEKFFPKKRTILARFIPYCAEAVAGGAIRKREVTRLLMANRLFTQSARMIVLSLKSLTSDFNSPPKNSAE